MLTTLLQLPAATALRAGYMAGMLCNCTLFDDECRSREMDDIYQCSQHNLSLLPQCNVD